MNQWQDRTQRINPQRPRYDWMGRPDPAEVEEVFDARGGADPESTTGAPSRRDERPPAVRRTVRHLLASREARRQAILMTEILGPPRALRPPEGP